MNGVISCMGTVFIMIAVFWLLWLDKNAWKFTNLGMVRNCVMAVGLILCGLWLLVQR